MKKVLWFVLGFLYVFTILIAGGLIALLFEHYPKQTIITGLMFFCVGGGWIAMKMFGGKGR